MVSGHITDALTGKPVGNASVYESMQLISAMTNEQGYYRLRLREKERPAPVMITISKELYRDTVMLASSGFDQEISASIKPAAPIMLSIVDVNQYSHVEQTWLGKVFISSRQRVQSLNLSSFFAKQPYQYSIVPGAGTHGRLGSQVVNKVSLNMIGGYTAGLNGVEMAGIFNIDQKDVRYVQVAGIFNVVGGKMNGVQLAGLHNHVMDSLKGLQAAGISNVLQKGFRGITMSGIANVSSGETQGVAAAGIANVLTGNNHGLQMAGIANVADTTNGVQISGIFNVTRILHGVQVGVVNIADSSDGYSIGILSIVKKGYHQLLVYNTELLHLNLAYRSGNQRLYSLILAGANFNPDAKAYSIGYGIGKPFFLPRKNSITMEVTEQSLFLGDWETAGSLVRLQAAFNHPLKKGISIYAGPAFSIYYNNSTDIAAHGYKSVLPGPYSSFTLGQGYACWFGWHVGFTFF